MHEHAHQHAKETAKKVPKSHYNEAHGKPGLLDRVRSSRNLTELEQIIAKGLPEGASAKTVDRFYRAVSAKTAELKAEPKG